jgi:hypothetical protein
MHDISVQTISPNKYLGYVRNTLLYKNEDSFSIHTTYTPNVILSQKQRATMQTYQFAN